MGMRKHGCACSGWSPVTGMLPPGKMSLLPQLYNRGVSALHLGCANQKASVDISHTLQTSHMPFILVSSHKCLSP
jgi:hypothetical protein